MLDYSHDGLFALAALAVALIAGFSGLSLTRGASQLGLVARQGVVAVASVVLGWGIWSMHFVAMLGLDLPVVFLFDPLITLISALIVILFMEMALLLVHFGPRTRTRISLAGAILGLGIAAMHFTGMSGMEICRPVYSALGVGGALVASVGLGVLSFQISYGARSPRNILLGTLGFGMTVCAVHFIAMAGTGFTLTGAPEPAGLPMSREVLAFGVTISAFVLSGLFLLTGASFTARLSDREPGAALPGRAEPAPPGAVPAPMSTMATMAPVSQASPMAAVSPTPPAAAPPAVPAPRQPTNPAPARPSSAPTELRIPYEADHRTHFIAAEAVSVIRAEGHYTLLYAGTAKHFCPWSITEAARRLPDTLFTRTHRSFLVNHAHVTSFERRKDNGVCHFDRLPDLPEVPVSRARLQDVRAQLGL
ncbi:MHYT domain-containing protein [Marinibacterium sp. SX1]|uniref:MHYT domain-containing protein n=1 Tax=Marinibacterium sp. SX1 TaxID=3388424 RepID=UPI003D182446